MNEWVPSFLLVAAVAAPLLGVMALAVTAWRPTVLRAMPWTALSALMLALWGETNASLMLPWLVKHTVLELDMVGRVFLAFSGMLWLASGWHARAALAPADRPVQFHIFFQLAMAGNFLLILAGDVSTFYVGFALMGLASAGLVFHRGDDEASRAGRLYLTLAMLGEVLILTGFVFLVASDGTKAIAELHQGDVSPAALGLLLVGFGIKAGALSLHFWLPLAHPAAPVPASAVLSGAMIKAGLLGWIRFLPLGEAAVPWCGYLFISAGVGAAFLGTFVGVAQANPKTVLAYSSFSQMGIIMTGLGIGALKPEAWPEIQLALLIYATHHALAKGSLFLGIGPAHAARSRGANALVRTGLLLAALALAGAPFTSGALAKTALKSHFDFLPGVWANVLPLLLALAAVGTTLKMARFLWLTWPRSGQAVQPCASGLWTSWLMLVGAVPVAVWFLPGALDMIPVKLTPATLWDAVWPLLAGGGLAALGAALRRRVPGDLTRWLPAGDVGVFLLNWLSGVRRRLPMPRKSGEEHAETGHHDARSGSGVDGWHATGQRADAIERYLRHWAIAGAVFLLLVLVFFRLLGV